MKLENIIMMMEKQKGTATNFLLNLTDYMEMALDMWGDYAEDMAGAIGTLYETKMGKREWSDLYMSADKKIYAAFCGNESQLRGFLMGSFNSGEWFFDERRCTKNCLDVLRIYNMKTDGHALFPYLHYEPVEHVFHVGEILRNMNGNDYRVLAALSPQNLLLISLLDGQIIVGNGVRLYERYPKGEYCGKDSIVTGIEWDHGVYLGKDITRLDFDILKQEHGGSVRCEELSGLRGRIRRDFWAQKNVEQKEILPWHVRNAAKECLEAIFGTKEPHVFDAMLDQGMYDTMYQTKEKQEKIPGQLR